MRVGADWVKIRTDLIRDPKVGEIVNRLIDPESELSIQVERHTACKMSVTRDVMRGATVGALVSVWGVTRHHGRRHGDDLVVEHASLESIDDIAGIPGFARAMADVGWLVVNGRNVVFPKFFESHNVSPEESAREKKNERQRRYRERQKAKNEGATEGATVAPQRGARVRVREEEKKKDLPIGKSKEKTTDVTTSKPAKRFKPPSPDEVRAYALERGAPEFDPERFVDFYTAKGWKVGDQPMKDWKAAVRYWIKNDEEKGTNGKQLTFENHAQRLERSNADAMRAFIDS